MSEIPKTPRPSFTFKIVRDDGTVAIDSTREAIDFFALQPEGSDTFYILLGKVVIQWGKIEILVDNAVEYLSPLLPELSGKKPTKSLKRKTEWIKKALKNHAHLSDEDELITKALERLKTLSLKRNHIIHSNYRGFDKSSGVVCLKINTGDNDLLYTLSDLEKFLDELVHLHTFLWSVTTMIAFFYPLTIPQMSNTTS